MENELEMAKWKKENLVEAVRNATEAFNHCTANFNEKKYLIRNLREYLLTIEQKLYSGNNQMINYYEIKNVEYYIRAENEVNII